MIGESLGTFYLGTTVPAPGEPVLYDSRDLTTHAVCVGMTGSGKTGLCLSLLEEALLDGVPVIAIDPKGDLGNLMLTFPALAPADFAPWVAPAQAARDGVSVAQLAATTAERWRDQLALQHADLEAATRDEDRAAPCRAGAGRGHREGRRQEGRDRGDARRARAATAVASPGRRTCQRRQSGSSASARSQRPKSWMIVTSPPLA